MPTHQMITAAEIRFEGIEYVGVGSSNASVLVDLVMASPPPIVLDIAFGG